MDLEQIRQKYGLLLIILHGSQVTGEVHPRSDIDIAVVKKDKNSSFNLLDLIADLKVIFNGLIDVSDITFADPLFLFAVIKKCKLLAGDIEEFKKLEKTSFFKYSDYMPYLKMESDFITERINSYAKN